MSEKTEQPTPKKLRDARESGQIAVSRDLAKLASLAVVGEVAFGTESIWHGQIDALISLSIMRIGRPFDYTMVEMLTAAGKLLLLSFGAVSLLCILSGVAAFWGQVGVLIAPKAATPKFDRLDPVQGMKQLFSGRKVMETLMVLFKAILIGLILAIVIRDRLPTIVQMANGSPGDIYRGFVAMLHAIFRLVLLVSACFTIADFLIQKHFHIKGLMMSLEDIKKEYKESEGDPLIKGKRRQLAMELANSAPVAKTENANAVVVNPTHFAVALYYKRQETGVPVVLAKGKDEIAQAMIERARMLGIPVIRHVWLARTLYATARTDKSIPKSSFEAVAHVYATIKVLTESGAPLKNIELEAYGDPPSGR